MSVKDGLGFVFATGCGTFIGFLFGYFQWRAGAVSSGLATGAGLILGTSILMILFPIIHGILNVHE